MSYLSNSRRIFLKTLSSASILPAPLMDFFTVPVDFSDGVTPSSEIKGKPDFYDGPHSSLFTTIQIEGNLELSELADPEISKSMSDAVQYAPFGNGTSWGIPFDISKRVIFIKDDSYAVKVKPISTNWLVFLHTSDAIDMEQSNEGFYKKPFKGIGFLNEHAANYYIIYGDGEEVSVPIRQRHQIGMFQIHKFGENCTESKAHHKPIPARAHHEQMNRDWGRSQRRILSIDRSNWINWLWAWENPHPHKKIEGFRFESMNKTPLVLSAISAGSVNSNPLRWQSRKKAILTLQEEEKFNPVLDEDGLLSQIKLDLGQIISANHRLLYPDQEWQTTHNHKLPETLNREILIEFTAHPEACFHLYNNTRIPVSKIDIVKKQYDIRPVTPASHLVKLRVVEKNSTKPVPVKIHIHGESGEYLPPVDRHRIPNTAMFEDYSTDLVYGRNHYCTYISGETDIKLPLGKIYVEISKGFEIKPFRKVVPVASGTEEITIELEKVIYWREKGWVTADTHVHFLSPATALLEGAAEGVNVVNLLASQWGELMTNVGDFDGRTTFGSKESCGDGEYLVRVGTENRQHVLGHISLLGYEGKIISPLATGGPDESALGDPIEVLLTEWGKQCIAQNGVVVLPHFPHPRMENAAAIVTGNVHGVEVARTDNFYQGINPYSLTDWYRYLNCGYFTAAVGGTDKMDAEMPLGAIRTYAKIDDNLEFTYDQWKESVIKGHTFVTCGPLMDITADGQPMGSKIEISAGGGTVDFSWEVASITLPMTHVELIVNGEVRESVEVSPGTGKGNWSVKVDKSSWLALLVRGRYYPDRPEIIAAHSSPVMINVEGSPMMAAADAVTILEQIEGALKHIETVGTRADEKSYKRMRLMLESAHRSLHNRMHQMGQFHDHSPEKKHHMHNRS